MSIIIDRRLNDRNKSAANRERFIRRYKNHIRQAVTDLVAGRSIRDMERGGDVKIPVADIAEPTLRHGAGGDRETVHPGNHRFNAGDRIARPDGGGKGRGGQGDGDSDAGGQGDGQDGFSFSLSRDEFMELFFEDLELPHMVRTLVGDVVEQRTQRAGYNRQGAPVNLSVSRSLRNALGRRIALSGGTRRALAAVQAGLDAHDADAARDPAGEPAGDAAHDPTGDPVDDAARHPTGDPAGDTASDRDDAARRRDALLAERTRLRAELRRVPFLDELDLRYRHRVVVPRPVSQAVMFCLMDVSASMDERKKDLAKRFFTLLFLFLSRRYEKVEVVFIRHTEQAEEVDEERFFHDARTGGTVVLSALELMRDIIDARFSPAQWNVYGAQASDGDAFGADPDRSAGFLTDRLLPDLRHFAYVEVPDAGSRPSRLSGAYRRIDAPHFAMRQVHERRDIYPVFRELFTPEAAHA